MAKRCTLCGGKLNHEGICKECGLNNAKYAANYSLSHRGHDMGALTHVHEDEENRRQKAWAKQQKKQKKATPNKPGNWDQSYDQGYGQGNYSQGNYGRGSQAKGGKTTGKGSSKKKGGCVMVVIRIFVFLWIIGILAGLVGEFLEDFNIFGLGDDDYNYDYSYEYDDEDVYPTPYDDIEVEVELEDTEETFDAYFEPGEYLVGRDIPAGYYCVETEDSSDWLEVFDETNDVQFESCSDESENYNDNLPLYPGAILTLHCEEPMHFSTENAQPLGL